MSSSGMLTKLLSMHWTNVLYTLIFLHIWEKITRSTILIKKKLQFVAKHFQD